MFKSKHKLDLSLVSMDARGKQLLNYTDQDIANFGGYDLVHHDDLEYVASAHQERKDAPPLIFFFSVPSNSPSTKK